MWPIKKGLHVFFRIPTHSLKSFSVAFQYLFNTKIKKFNTITSLNFSIFLIMKLNFTHCITLCKCFAFSKILPRYLRFLFHLEFPYFFNTWYTFWQYSILFQGLENQFWNSILSNCVGTLIFLQTLGVIFQSQTTLGTIFVPFFRDFAQIFIDFSVILLGFSTNQNFWRCACIPASYTTGLRSEEQRNSKQANSPNGSSLPIISRLFINH